MRIPETYNGHFIKQAAEFHTYKSGYSEIPGLCIEEDGFTNANKFIKERNLRVFNRDENDHFSLLNDANEIGGVMIYTPKSTIVYIF